MSTRRARIKAVASLPVRRKNQESKDSAKDKPCEPKQEVENVFTTVEEPKKVAEIPSECENVPPETSIDCKPNHTPKRGRRTSIHTPNLIERSRTPKSKEQTLSPHRKLSPAAKHAASPLALPLEDNQCSRKLIPTINTSTASNSTSQTIKPLLHKTKEAAGKDAVDGILSIQDYNPPSIPESITDETVLDGIVPLHSNRSIPKPLDLLKNEIISENAEVLFDPIVPLPSPSKARPKLRPAPRLAFRRNSVQGSASESEDESRRALLVAGGAGAATPAPLRQRHDSHTSHSTQFTLPNRDVNRVRNDSICSSVSQIAQPLSQPSSTSVLVNKEKQKNRRTDMSRRVTAMRRRQRGRENVPRDTLTMYDLIFFNPTTNPIVPDPEEPPVAKQVETKEAEPAPVKEAEAEEQVDDPPERQEAAPVPQIKLGPNGEIILDEKSLVIEQTEGPRQLSSSVVHEGGWASGGRGKYTRRKRTADWTDAETVRFYRALAAVGTDFTLMSPLFPDRNRRDLKQKFKKEERANGGQVDRALRSQTQWDATRLQDEFAEERQLASEKAAKMQQAYTEQKRAERARTKLNRHEGFRPSRGAKAIEFNMNRGVMSEGGTADDLIENALQAKREMKQLKESRSRPKLPPPKALPKRPIPQLVPLINPNNPNEFATLTPARVPPPPSRFTPHAPVPVALTYAMPNLPKMPDNIENGSLVVLTVDDPNEPSKKMLQTYISYGTGNLTPVALPPNLLNSVVSYMKKGTPKSGLSSSSSPQLTSPSSVASQDSRSSVIQFNPSPSKRARHNSFTITPL